jgi:hypothetical protein
VFCKRHDLCASKFDRVPFRAQAAGKYEPPPTHTLPQGTRDPPRWDRPPPGAHTLDLVVFVQWFGALRQDIITDSAQVSDTCSSEIKFLIQKHFSEPRFWGKFQVSILSHTVSGSVVCSSQHSHNQHSIPTINIAIAPGWLGSPHLVQIFCCRPFALRAASSHHPRF